MSKMMFQASEDELSPSECHEQQIWPNAHLWLAAGARSAKGVPVKLPLVVPRQALLKTLHDAIDSQGVVLATPSPLLVRHLCLHHRADQMPDLCATGNLSSFFKEVKRGA